MNTKGQGNLFMYVIHFSVIFDYLDILWAGMLVTFQLSVLTMLFGTILGIFVAIARLSKNRLVYFFSTAYIEVLRNVPVLLVLYIIYYGSSSYIKGLSINTFWASVIALSINSSAYEAEIIRGGVKGIMKEEIEAAFSLSLRKMQVFYYVIIPHALRLIWDALGNQLVAIILGSSIASIITLDELTYNALGIGSRTARHFEIFVVLLLIYVVLGFILSSLFRLIKKLFLRPANL
jgi:polar amino acid transport system permease protein